jgi:hypothetical protein
MGFPESLLTPAVALATRIVKNLKRIEKAWFPVSIIFSYTCFLKPQQHVQSGFDDQV